MKNLFDGHNHCQFSFDGKRTSVELSSKAALEKGLGGIIFTDHCDLYIPQVCLAHGCPEDQTFDIIGQQAEIDRVQEMLGDSIRILKGIEIGMYGKSMDKIKETLRTHSFDQVNASIHYLHDSDPYYPEYFSDKDWKEAYGLYLEAICKGITSLQDFDIVGHYDYVVRYASYPADGIFYKDFSDILDTIFRYLIENGKGFEVNTKACNGSSSRKPVLDKNLLLRYRELGGEIVSLGSDSHDAFKVAEDFQMHAEFLKSLGFRWTSHYEKRQLVQLPL